MRRYINLGLRPWRWLKNRRLKPGVLLKIYLLLGLDSRKSPAFLAAKFDASKSEYLLADWQEKYVVSGKDRVIGRAVYCTGAFELGKFEKVRALLGLPTEHMVFVDIGANIGTMCIPMLTRGHFARAIAIEPEPQNARLLGCNIQLNGVSDRIEVHEVAAGGRAGIMALYLSDHNFGDHCLRADRATMDDRQSVQVNVIELDELIPPDQREELFLWVDTQGYEGFVLQGARKVIASAPPLVLEFSPFLLAQAQSYEALRMVVLEAPYTKVFDLALHWPAPMPVTAETMDRLFFEYPDKHKFTDLLFIK